MSNQEPVNVQALVRAVGEAGRWAMLVWLAPGEAVEKATSQCARARAGADPAPPATAAGPDADAPADLRSGSEGGMPVGSGGTGVAGGPSGGRARH